MYVEVFDTLLDHLKVKRIVRDLGIPAVVMRGIIVSIWLQAVRHKEDGCLSGWTPDDIADYSGWDEFKEWIERIDKKQKLADASHLVDAITAHGLFDLDMAGDLWIHDWNQYAGRLKRADTRRRDRERKRAWRERQLEMGIGAEAADEDPQEENVRGTVTDVPVTVTNVPGTNVTVPGTSVIVTPDRIGSDRIGSDQDQINICPDKEASAEPTNGKRKRRLSPVKTEDVDVVCAHYVRYHPRAKPNEKDRAKIRKRLEEGWQADDLRRAIDGCHASPFHSGDNETGTKYQSLELIVRDAGKVQKFIEMFENKPEGGSGAGRKGRRNLDAVKDFISRQRDRVSGNGGQNASQD